MDRDTIFGKPMIGPKSSPSDLLRRFAVLLACFILVSACGRSYQKDFPDKRSATGAFQDEFGFTPSAQVSQLRARVLQQGDAFARWIEFCYDRETIDRILSQDWVRADRVRLDSGAVWSNEFKNINPNAPAWWPKDGMEDQLIYYTEKPHASGAQHYAYLVINVSSGVVFCKSCIWQ